MARTRLAVIALAVGAAVQALFTTLGLSALAVAAYNYQRNRVGIGGNPVRDPATWGILVLLGSGVLVAFFLLVRTQRPVRAVIITQAVTAVIAGVVMTVGLFVYLFTGGSVVVAVVAI